MSEELLVTNITGEPFQPVRIYYKVTNKKTILGVFKKLKCVEYDPARKCWVWFYKAEAEKIKFEISYNKIPKEKHPIIIGYFIFKTDREMLLELRSFERVIKALNFFTKRINWRVAEPTRLRIVNKLFTTPPHTQLSIPNYDDFFERDDVCIRNAELLEKELMEIENQHDDPEKRSAAIDTYFKEKSKLPLPETEELSINIHGGGIEVLNLALKMKHIETLERWNGNENFVMQDLIERMLEHIPEDELKKQESKDS
ncbi:hypothetical protein [Cyanobacterium sp. uoEpiScrs1]|uniref:hypothetical protein n=1 Tax=Cyanobacterium sp. uoEpiScrs1 TaxID=2976343 RepID=UPI00226A5505|nr:hypothetical protein [Cyanobacterium sp. uoEpiScrs1]